VTVYVISDSQVAFLLLTFLSRLKYWCQTAGMKGATALPSVVGRSRKHDASEWFLSWGQYSVLRVWHCWF